MVHINFEYDSLGYEIGFKCFGSIVNGTVNMFWFFEMQYIQIGTMEEGFKTHLCLTRSASS